MYHFFRVELAKVPSALKENKSPIERLISHSKARNYHLLRNKREYYDNAICNILQEDPSTVRYIDYDYFYASFNLGLNQSILYILNNHADLAKKLFLNGDLARHSKRSHPLVRSEFQASEGVVLKVLDVCHDQIKENLRDRNYTLENVLHILVRRGYEKAAQKLLAKYTNVSEIYFDCDRNGMTPFMSALSKNSIQNENLLIQLWNDMMKRNKVGLVDVIKSKDQRHNNLFHLCARFSKYDVFTEVGKSISSDMKSIRLEIARALLEPHKVSGNLPFHLLRDEKGEFLMIDLLVKLQDRELELGIDLTKDFVEVKNKKKNNSLSTYAKRNYKLVIDWIMNYTSNENLKKFLLEVNIKGNNSPMICVVHNRNSILKRYLMFLFSTNCVTNKELEQFLHQRNIFNETILSLVLQHESTMLLPQMLLLEKEKEIHQNNGNNGEEDNKTGTMESLSSCLRNNDLRSAEVAKTIARVDDSYEKTTCWEKFRIIISIMITSFLIPMAIQVSDLSFDGLVVHNYWSKVVNVSKVESLKDDAMSISYNCRAKNFSNDLADIPAALDDIPILGYSLAFMIFPCIFYTIEYFMSRYFKETEREVSMLTNILLYASYH